MKMTNRFLNEEIDFKLLTNGAKCYITPKAGFREKQAVLSVGAGSSDFKFLLNGVPTVYPVGIAHFLEHKMFEAPEGLEDRFSAFLSRGADVNAYTNFYSTSYYFTCQDNFEENLKMLIEMAQTPHITEESVEKEKGIIIQEINQYADDPFWRGALGLLDALYFENPVKHDVAGTAESVSAITPALLYDCHALFYAPRNMVLTVVGEVNPGEVFDIAEKYINQRGTAPLAERHSPPEPEYSRLRENAIELGISRPFASIGFKDDPREGDHASALAAGKVLADMLAGPSTEFYSDLREKGLIDDACGIDYAAGRDFRYLTLAAATSEPRALGDALCGRLASAELPPEAFERAKRKQLGKTLRIFNNIGHTALAQADLLSHGKTVFDLSDAYEALTLDDVERKRRFLSAEGRGAMSIVN
ncbi:MAG: insulinase family protein [Clostridiales bacterium]|jgi:predicted Zn-dependent peptidase|nr:insulinase family protein [Clostridiales bacterium]